MRALTLLALLLFLALVSLLFSLASGSVSVNWQELPSLLSGNGDELARQIIMELRWPRAVAAFTTGALLSVAGALMQVLLRNPLADPYVLGISGGAATGALLALLLGLGSLGLHSAAFCGALLSMLLVFSLSHGSGNWTSSRLLLTGVVHRIRDQDTSKILQSRQPRGNLTIFHHVRPFHTPYPRNQDQGCLRPGTPRTTGTDATLQHCPLPGCADHQGFRD